MKKKRIYHNYKKWEEYQYGMWRAVYGEEKEALLKAAIEFTGNAQRYGHYMMIVAKTWKYSCEHNLTDTSINQQAWIGHAACALAINCPEDITRAAWWFLSEQQQDEANAMADKAIKYWHENIYSKKNGGQLCLKFD